MNGKKKLQPARPVASHRMSMKTCLVPYRDPPTPVASDGPRTGFNFLSPSPFFLSFLRTFFFFFLPSASKGYRCREMQNQQKEKHSTLSDIVVICSLFCHGTRGFMKSYQSGCEIIVIFPTQADISCFRHSQSSRSV